MQLLRDALEALGPSAKPKEIQAKIHEASGLTMSTAMISSYKTLLKKSGKTKANKPGRPSKVASAPGSANITDDIVLIRKLINRLGAKQMSDLIEVLK